MSQHTKPKLIIEWSPSQVIALHTPSGTVRTGETVAAAMSSLPTGDALIAISRRTSFVRTTRVPNASQSDVALILRNQISGLFPLSGEELAYDFELTDDVSAEGRLALVAGIQAEHLRQVYEECKAAGVKIGATVPAALGSVELMRKQGLRDAAVVQVDEHGAAIDVVAQGVLRYSRWTAATRDVPAEVRRTFAAAGIEQLAVLASGGSSLPAEYHASESTLLALAQIDLAKPPLNIELGEEKAKRAAMIRTNTFRVSGLVLAAGVVAAVVVGYDRFTQVKVVQAAVDAQQRSVTALKKQDDAAKKTVTDATNRFKTVSRGFAPAQHFWEVLAILTNDAPPGVWLTGLSMERGRPLTVRGTATSAGLIASYTDRLATEERLRDVHLVYSNDAAIDNHPVVEFSLTGFPVGNIPLVDPPGAPVPPPEPSTTKGGSA
ncbi:MAG: PilN domain-containing protein [Fimbriimonadaceae bacterium]